MTNKLQRDVEEALEHGAKKIEELRRHNEVLTIKADTFDAMARLVALLTPRTPQGYEMDAAWQMRKVLDEFKAANATEAPSPAAPDA